jgi:hypothetical protein
MRLRHSSLLALLTLTCSLASGAIIPSFQVTNPGPLPGLPGYVGGVLRIHSDQGNITAFDFGGTDPAKPDEANKGIFATTSFGGTTHGPGFSQRWTAFDDGTGNVTLTPSPKRGFTPAELSNPNNRDSYFNGNIAETAIVYLAEEDNSLVGSPLSPTNPPAGTPGVFWGLGTSMHYTTGIMLAGQAATIDLAYLVIDSRKGLHVRGEVAVGTKIPVDWVIWPEPSSAAITVLAAIGILARRRRV